MDYKTIMAEFEEDVNSFSAKRKHFLGVSKKGNSWQAIIRDPKLKIEIYLGYYSTPEEAALVVKKKKAEFEDKLKGEDGLRMKSCGNAFQETESEEAAVVSDRKRAELREVCGGKVTGSGECEDDDEVLRECESEVTGNFECSDEQTSDVKVPAGVRRVRSGEWVARINDPASNDRIWLGTCDTAEEAIRSFDKRRVVQMGYDGLNNIEIGDKPNCGVFDVPDKLECEFVQGSPTSNIKPGTSNSGCASEKRVSDKTSKRKTTCSLEFDEAVSAGFINEYGQLVGKYCELDEQLSLGLTDENFAASG